MIHLRFLTDANYPLGTLDDRLLIAPLRARGVAVEWVNWREIAPTASPHVLRSTWDYHRDAELFLAVMAGLPNLQNPQPTLAWNANKRYLTDLANAGIPVVPTTFSTLGEALAALHREFRAVVLKPAIGAGGERTYHIQTPEMLDAVARLHPPSNEVWLTQPYLDTVATLGELSVMIAGNEVTHAVIKHPAADQFLVQEEHGGRSEHIAVNADIARLAQRAAACAPTPTKYARVDFLFGPDGPLVAELELVEPALYLSHSASAVEQFADIFASLAT